MFIETTESIELPDLAVGNLPQHHIVQDALPKDHFITKDGMRFAGYHLIADFWGCSRINELDLMEQAMRDAVIAAGATLLHIHLHHFTPNGGVSGVAVLAESHISVHTWPEFGFAAFDIFMCGDAKPHEAIKVLKSAFNPQNVLIDELQRGNEDLV